jgi:CubicO group peptidase (beta-lactamase class C family)
MNLDVKKIEQCIVNQSDPEPFSGVVHLTVGDDAIFEGAYGLAIRSESIPNTVDTRFQMASGCKGFTAVGILHLIEEGKLALTTPLIECVDMELPRYPRDLTIGHLLTHSAGITSYFEEDVDPDYEAVWKDVPVHRIRGPRDFLPLFIDKPMKFKPGEKFEYNDGGFILLGLVIECITGMKFEEYIAKTVLEPAGMTDSGYFATDMLPGRTAYAYIPNPDGSYRTNFFAVPVIGAPDGGAYTTAPDMARFWKALIGNRLLSAKWTDSMIKVQIATGSGVPYDHYGLGIWINRSGDKVRRIFLEGYDPGVALRSAFYSEYDVILTLIGNTAEALWPLYKTLEAELGL